MTRIGDIGSSKYLDWDVKASFYVSLALIKQSNKYNSKFLNQYIKTSIFQNELHQRTLHIAFPKKINLGEINKCITLLPSLPEQEKIAAFLSKVDEKIEKTQKKKELWEKYKKGIMQQLFSQELRFKADDGKDFPDWQKKRFGDVFTFLPTNSFSRALLNSDKGEIHNIHYGDIHTKYQSFLDAQRHKIPFINQDVDLSRVNLNSYCREGDLIIADASEDYADIGKATEIKNIKGAKILAGLHTFLARDNKNLTAFGYRGYILLEDKVKRAIKEAATGISVLGISKTNLSKVFINLPTLSEQQKIASFFTAIDSKIELVSNELQGLKEFKKGLLQKMFV